MADGVGTAGGAREFQFDFSKPEGAPALLAPTSVQWRVFRNPIALGVGGVAAVLLEFADARIRSAVRRPTRISSAISSRVSPSALAAMRRASSINIAALSCLTVAPNRYVRFWRNAVS